MKKGPATPVWQMTILLGLLIATTLGQSALATDVYTWTDENGVVHFSDTKPAAAESKAIEMDDAPGGVSYSQPETGAVPAADGEAPLTAAQQRRQDITEKRKAILEEKAETEALCDRHRKRLEQMEPARRAYYIDESGQQVRMDDVQRVALVEESRNFLAENCN